MAIAACAVGLAFVIACLTVRFGRRSIPVVSPFGVFSIVFGGVYFVVPALQVLVDVSPWQGSMSAYDDREVAGAVMLAVIYYLVAFAAYILFRPATVPLARLVQAASRPAPSEQGMVQALIVAEIVAAGLTLWLYGAVLRDNYADFLASRIAESSGKGYLLDPIMLGNVAALMVLAPLLARRTRPQIRHLIVLSVALGVNVAGSLLLGRRLIAFMGFAYIGLAVAFLRQTKVRIWRLCLGSLVLLAIVLVCGTIRYRLKDGGYDVRSVLAADAPLIGDVRSVVNDLAANFGHVELLTILRRNSQSWTTEKGSTYVAAFAIPIPRALWPAKPLGGGPVLANIIVPGSYSMDSRYRSSLTSGCVPEAYLNWHSAGVFVVALVHGFGLATVTRYGRRIRFRYQFVIYVLLTAWIGEMLIYGEFYGVVARVLILTFPVWLYERTSSQIIPQRGLRVRRRCDRLPAVAG